MTRNHDNDNNHNKKNNNNIGGTVDDGGEEAPRARQGTLRTLSGWETQTQTRGRGDDKE